MSQTGGGNVINEFNFISEDDLIQFYIDLETRITLENTGTR